MVEVEERIRDGIGVVMSNEHEKPQEAGDNSVVGDQPSPRPEPTLPVMSTETLIASAPPEGVEFRVTEN